MSFKMKDAVITFADLRDDLHAIGQCYSNNLLLFNPSKTKVMVFGSRQMHSRLVTPSLTFRELVPEQTAKDLGVILDTNLISMTNTLLKLSPPVCLVSVK